MLRTSIYVLSVNEFQRSCLSPAFSRNPHWVDFKSFRGGQRELTLYSSGFSSVDACNMVAEKLALGIEVKCGVETVSCRLAEHAEARLDDVAVVQERLELQSGERELLQFVIEGQFWLT
jgi:hypothetical protein